MESNTVRMRTTLKGLKPFVMTNLKTQAGPDQLIEFIEERGMLKAG
jgi:urease accessory protein